MSKFQRHAGWIVLCLIVAAAYGQPVKSAGGLTPMNNVDLPGSDIKHFTLPSPPAGTFDLRQNQCAEACAKNFNCVAWTYVKPNTIQGPLGNCWLKNAIPAQKANNCCVSGTVGEANTDRPGSDYKHFDNIAGVKVTAQQCSTACYKDANCKAWTFVRPNTIQGPNGNCWLKNAVPAPVANNCCISGYYETTVIK